MAYKRISPQPVVEGGTGAQTLTDHGVLLGSGTAAVTPLGVATNGQLVIGSTGADPVLASITSTASTLTVTGGAGTLNIDVTAPLAIAFGGTNATSMTNTDGVVYYDGTRLVTTAVGSAAQVLTSNGAGVAPTFQTNAGGDVTGPGSATDNAITRFDGTTGKLIQNSVPTIDDTGNVSVSAAVSGADLAVTINNSSNTASATATQQITVGGSTAADATTKYTVTGVTNWTQGIDNSVSDTYKIAASTALGTTDTFVMTTAGQRTLPLQPMFGAFLSADITNATGDSTVVNFVCNTELYDIGSNYNNATGVFTAPVTGYYLFEVRYGLTGLLVTHTASFFQLQAPGNQFGHVGNPFNLANVSTSIALCIHYTVALTAADAVSPRVTVFNGTKVVTVSGTNTQFRGFLIC